MTPTVIILLVFAAFVIARLFRSTKMWWRLIFAIMSGLLVGILSKGITESKKDVNKPNTELTSTTNTATPVACMQSLVATVTEGTTECQSGVASNIATAEKLFVVNVKRYDKTNTRDPPEIVDDS